MFALKSLLLGLCAAMVSAGWAQNAPVISLVANAEGENPVIAPNTWVEVKGTAACQCRRYSRTWKDSDFHNNQLPFARRGQRDRQW